MEPITIFDAEMHLMVKIWDEGSIKAIDLANWATETLGWKKNSTYSILKKLLEKGAVHREEPGFVLTPLVTRDQVARDKTVRMVDKMYNGSMKLFLTGLLGGGKMNEKTLAELTELLEKAQEETEP